MAPEVFPFCIRQAIDRFKTNYLTSEKLTRQHLDRIYAS